jgi:beta-N-acetylhexosaminidase
MSTREPKDYQNNTSQAHHQQHRQADFSATNPFVSHQKQRRIATPSSPVVSLLKRYRPHGIKIWHFILLMLVIDAGILGQSFWQEFAKQTTQTASHATGGGLMPASQSVKQANTNQPLTNDMKYKQLARLYVNHMSLDDKLGQLIVGRFTASSYSPDLDIMINQQHIGGVILYANQIHTIQQVQADTARMESRTDLPLLIGTDQEGLTVNRLDNIYGPDSLTAQAMERSGNPNVATNEGKKIAQRLLNLGINVDFAPDIDVGIPGGYIDKDLRDFGHTVSDDITYAGAYVRGLQSGGTIACFKHFPGLGDVPANLDPHSTLPTVNADQDHIYTVDMATFKHFIQSTNPLEQANMIMATDVLMPAIDPKFPAELSHTFITDILRTQLGYDGVVISDSLHMQGVTIDGQQLNIGNAAVLAIEAGVDMALDVTGSTEVSEVINALKAALHNGTLTQARIDEAVTRIIQLKMERHLIST